MWFPIWHPCTGSHRAASVHGLHGARAADIKTLLVFLSGNLHIFSNIITHVGTNDARLSAVIRCSIMCVFHNASKKRELSQSGSIDYWQQVLFFFFKKSQIAFVLFQQQTELPGSARNTTALHQHRAQGELGRSSLTTFLQTTYSWASSDPPTHESVLVSIATGLAPPSFDVVSSVLHTDPVYSEDEMTSLLSNELMNDDVCVSDFGLFFFQTTTTNKVETWSHHYFTACF